MLENKCYEALYTKVLDSGELSFRDVMHHALYMPEHGYYMQRQSVFGASGDFVTAPMLSSRLAEAIAAWINEQKINSVLEIAPGNGMLAQQVLAHCPNIETYFCLDLNNYEVAKLNHAKIRVVDQFPEGFRGAVIANEWLDALPFQRFCFDKEQGVSEFRVKVEDGKLVLFLSPLGPIEQVFPDLEALSRNWPTPYIFERTHYHSALSILTQCQGPLLLIDYGYESKEYFHPDRALGSMLCLQKHSLIPFSLKQIGLFDITSAVNWTDVIQTLELQGYHLDKFGTQADFLSYYTKPYLCKEDHQLLEPHEMGQYIKVAAFN